ncbi:MAG: MFS transporter [Bacteroidales bacterium]
MELSPEEKNTFNLHLIYSIIDGVILGVLALNEFVFVKSLKGNDIQLSILFLFSSVVYVVTIIFNEFVKHIKNKKKLLRQVAVMSRVPLAFLFFFPHSEIETIANSYLHFVFLTIFFIYYLSLPIFNPIINLFLKVNYKHENFGRLYSFATSANKVVMLVITFIYGLLLDFDHYAFTYIFPLVALLSIFSIYLLSKINFIESIENTEKIKLLDAIKKSFLNMNQIIKKNIAYRHFEIGFMYYGFAFMGTISIMTIFFEKGLNLNYSSVAFYKNSYNILAIIMLPFFGKLIGKIDPRKFGVITFASIMMYLLCLVFTEQFPYYFEFMGLKLYFFMLLFVLFNGIFAATMSLLWNIGSAYFCKNKDVANYQSIHMTLTGYRSIFAPFVGVIFYRWVGFSGTFIAGAGFLVVAIIIMFRSYKKYPNTKCNISKEDQNVLQVMS